jgi:hypothetical protein
LPLPLALTRRDRTLFFTRLRRWRERLCWAHNKLNAAPPAIRIVVLSAAVLAIFSVANVVYQILRKPTEMLFPVSATLNKLPVETRRDNERAILITALRRLVDFDPQPLLPQIQAL